MSWRISVADCREAMAAMPADSISAVVCDPPYMLTDVARSFQGKGGTLKPSGRPRSEARRTSGGFMGKIWDAPDDPTPAGIQAWHETWAREALRVLKPGGHLVAFGGTRTHHRLMCAIEDAGFEIRDTIGHMHAGPSLGVYAWTHAQGFPKGKDFAKDDAASRAAGHRVPRPEFVGTPFEEGWNVALKPAWEIILLARKPLIGSVAENVLAFGTGGLAIDRCRIGTDWATDQTRRGWQGGHSKTVGVSGNFGNTGERVAQPNPSGRWPTDLVLTHHPDCLRLGTRRIQVAWSQPTRGAERPPGYGMDGHGEAVGYADADGTEETARYACVPECPARLLDAQAGERGKSQAGTVRRTALGVMNDDGWQPSDTIRTGHPDTTGNASRFFPTFAWTPGEVEEATRFRFQAKASTRERGCGLPDGTTNDHPCTKPASLMRWLCRLVTPPSGTILDPFCGGGSTGIAAILEGFDFIGIDQDSHYINDIATHRLAHVARHGERWLEMATGGVGKTNTYENYSRARKVRYCPTCDRRWHSGADACGACGGELEWRDEQAERERRAVPRHNVPSAVTPDYADLPLFAKTGDD